MQILGLSDSTPKPTSRIRELFWPRIDDDVAAVTAARNAMYASFWIAAGSAFGALVSGNKAAWVDFALYVMVGIGVRQLSRTAALTGVILYGLSWLATPIGALSNDGYMATVVAGMFSIAGLIRLIITVLLFHGVRAAALAHLMHKESAIDSVANPPLDTTGLSRVSVLLEEFPRKFWPVIRAPFMIVLVVLVAVSLMSLSLTTIVQQWIQTTASMEPTLLVGDRVVSLRPMFMGRLHRGDLVVLRYPPDPKTVLLKRIVGVPGDRIRIVNKSLLLNGVKVGESYVMHSTDYIDSYRDNFPSEPNVVLYDGASAMLKCCVHDGEVVIPEHRVFAMGDNRDVSLDSRYWGFVTEQDLVGRPILVLYSSDNDQARQERRLLWLPRHELVP